LPECVVGGVQKFGRKRPEVRAVGQDRDDAADDNNASDDANDSSDAKKRKTCGQSSSKKKSSAKLSFDFDGDD
jgi:hypothetical protein